MTTLRQAAKGLKGHTITTGGDGLWSQERRRVQIERVEVSTSAAAGNGREEFLQVYLTPETWDFRKDGLIYTDEKWIKGLRRHLRELGYARAGEVNYTEQGQQGSDYVHLIVGRW